MSQTITIAWGVCAPMRPQHVRPLLEPYGVRVEHLDMFADETGSGARVTVSDAAAKWVEYLLLRSGKFALMSPPLEPRNAQWAARWQTLPAQVGCDGHTAMSRKGDMPTPWSKRQRPQRRRTNARQRQQNGIIGTVARLFKGG